MTFYRALSRDGAFKTSFVIPNQTLKKSKPLFGGELCWVDLFTLTCSEKEETFENLPNSTDHGYCGTSGISLEKQSGHFFTFLQYTE